MNQPTNQKYPKKRVPTKQNQTNNNNKREKKNSWGVSLSNYYNNLALNLFNIMNVIQ